MIKKAALWTDIHFGKRNNSILHNEDCLNFVKWFIQKIKEEGDVTHIIFLGDFFDSAVNIYTELNSIS